MFYKFNQITQGLRSTTQESSMGQSMITSVSQKMEKTAEPLNIHYEYATEKPATTKTTATVKPSEPRTYAVPNNARYRKLMDMQTKFTIQDGLLVWQKLPKDLPLYYTTVVLVTVGFGLTTYSLLKLATPPKNN